MTDALMIGGMLAVGGPAVWLWNHRRSRSQLVNDLARCADERASAETSVWSSRTGPHAAQTEFVLGRLTRVSDVLAAGSLESLRAEARDVQSRVERSFVPGHKKGGTVCYESICRHSPLVSAVYHSPELQKYVGSITGEEVYRTPPGDQSSCSLLYYTEAGDHIGWHYDHNFYRGRHFTVLLTLVNDSANGGLSASMLQRQTPDGGAIDVDTSPNSLVVLKARGCGIERRRLLTETCGFCSV